MTYLASAALILTVAVLIPMGGVLFAPFLFGLFLLALVGVLARHTDRRVRTQDPTMDATGWRSRA
jgi:hypothetical protein